MAKTPYILMAIVDSGENASLAVLPEATYEAWNSSEINTDAADHMSLAYSKHATLVDSYPEALAHVEAAGGEIVSVKGGIAY